MAATIDHIAVPSSDPEGAARLLAHLLGDATARPEGPAVAFPGVVERLGEAGLDYGNEPEHPDNGRTDDPLGGPGRVYFVSPDGHLFEVTVSA